MAAQNTRKTPKGRPWQPGQSGNPGGRPKGLASAVREKAPPSELVRWYTAIWLRDEVELATLGVDPEACTLTERNKAGEWLTERGYGKAPAFSPIEDNDPLELGSIADVRDFVDDLAGIRARRETPDADPMAPDGSDPPPELDTGREAGAAAA